MVPRVGIALVVLVVAASGCRTTFVRSGTVPEPAPTGTPVRVGSEVQARLDAADATPRPTPGDPDHIPAGHGVFVLTARDQNGSGPDGIPLTVTGPVDGAFATDEGGRVHVVGPAGQYHVRIPVGCSGDVDVMEGGAGRFGIAAGQTGGAQLPVRWRHRFAPGGPADYSVTPYWPLGEEVEVRYRVIDRCRGGIQAPDASIASYRYQLGPRLEIVGEPILRADAEGHAFLTVRCLSDGQPSLEVVDAENSPDRLDLVEARLSTDQGLAPDEGPSCGSPYAG